MHKARAFFYVCAGLFLLALAYHFGARSAAAQAPAGEVALLSGSLTAVNVPEVPLPVYADGTVALESECRWIVGIGFMDLTRFGASLIRCEAIGRYPQIQPSDNNNPSRANYLIIAVRGSGAPTPAQQETWGAMKSRYRGERGATQTTPQDR